jgi:transposase
MIISIIDRPYKYLGANMSGEFIAGNRDQLLLLPPSVDKWVAKDHVVRFICDCVRQMDMFAFYSSYGKEGRPPYDPAMMLAVLIYAYSEGIRSSRKIAKACAEQLPFRWLTGNVVPDHCAVARFRSRHEKLIRKVFVEALKLCHGACLVNLGKRLNNRAGLWPNQEELRIHWLCAQGTARRSE